MTRKPLNRRKKREKKVFLKKISKKVLTFVDRYNIISLVVRQETKTKHKRRRQQLNKTISKWYIGVWLSLARAPGLGPGGRRFESCHPDCCKLITASMRV